jgi:trimeric autotransporter adhesin
VPGGRNNTALGSYSFAAGRRAKANHLGAFVWGAGTDADVASTGINTFIVRAPGGIWFGIDSSPTTPLDRFINTSTGAHLTTGGVWTNGSDRNSKENFTPVDAQRVLAQVAALPIATWNYRAESPSVRHMGPMAQDFSAAFGLGADDVSIGTIDVDGVALAAIQGLYQLTQAQEAENAAQKAEIAELVNRLAALEGQAKQGAAPSPVFPGWLALLLGLGGVAVSLVWHGRQAGRP